jgi:flagellar hook-associated protein FlgK
MDTKDLQEQINKLKEELVKLEKKHKEKINELVSENNKKAAKGNSGYKQISSLF